MKQWRIAFWSAGAYTALAVVVSLGLLNGLDGIVREWARPDDVWGVAQLQADLVVEGLRPAIAALLLATFTLCRDGGIDRCIKDRCASSGPPRSDRE